MPRKLFLTLGGILSLIAQMTTFAPEQVSGISGLSAFSLNGIRVMLFLAAAIFLFIAIQNHPAESRHDWLLLSIQAFTIVGVLFLLDGANSRLRENGFLLTGLISLLTTTALLASAEKDVSSPLRTTFNEQTISDFIYEPSGNTHALQEQIDSLSRQLLAEKYRTAQLILLNELSQQIETELDPPVSAQLAVNTLERAISCSLVTLFMYEPDQHEYVVLASAGGMTSLIPPGYRQSADKGLLGRITRSKKTSIINDTRIEPDFLRLPNDETLSIIIVPITQHGHIKGALEICSEKLDDFGSLDANLAEDVAAELLRAWDRTGYQQHITELIQAGISPNTLMMEPQASVQEVAIIARKTLEAQFVFVTLLDQQGNFSRHASAGNAPKLLAALHANPSKEELIQTALNSPKPFRIRDVRKYATNKLEIDRPALRSVMAIPIRLHRISIGTIIAFGKQDDVFFNEKDESLAVLLSSQAASSLESSWLYQDLRVKASIYKLLVDIIETDEITDAARIITESVHKMTNSKGTGIVLMNRAGEMAAEVEIDANGFHTRREHPTQVISQALNSGLPIMLSSEDGSLACFPLQTSQRTYGALWLNLPPNIVDFDNQGMLAKQVAMVWARSILLSELRQQAKELEAAYAELELTYDHTLTSLMSALDARDRETEGHSKRVSQLACLLGEQIGLSGHQLKALERGALLHDIGKMGISDAILHKPGKLTEEEWKIMRVHPDIGARIVEGIPFLQETIPVIQYHHERWDGSGYPAGLCEGDIPIQARIFAVVDVFDALTSRRSYRHKSTAQEAVEYLKEQAGILFDPSIIEAFMSIPYTDFTEGEK